MEHKIPNAVVIWSLRASLALGTLSFTAVLAAQARPSPLEANAHGTPHASLVVTRSEGAENCPDAEALAEQVHRVAGARVVTAGTASAKPADSWIRVAISRNFGGYRAELSASGLHRGARTLEDMEPGCASLADAIAITIAMFLDPYSAPSPEVVVRIAAERAQPSRREQPAEPATFPRVGLELAPGVAIGVLDHVEPIIAGRVAWHATDRWAFALGGGFVFPDLVRDGAHEVDLHLSYAALTGCVRTVGDAHGARLDWCIEQLLGSLSGSGRHYVDDASKQALWVATASGPEIVLPFTPSLAWTLTAVGVLPLLRQGFDADSEGQRHTVFRSNAAGALVTVGIRGEL